MNGWLVINKQLGDTSTRLGSKLKRLLKVRKIGHLGTLDPLASGVLIFALGEATKLIPYITWDRKVYECEITWGEARTTDDAEGEIYETSAYRPSLEHIQKHLAFFIGNIQQRPPHFSAVHIEGKRAYAVARQGKLFDLPLRNVRIDHIEIIEHTQSTLTLRVLCGSGVYIRSLGRDLAKSLGTCGYISRLKRTVDGHFLLKDAILLEKIAEITDKLKVWEVILPMETVLDDIPVVSVSQEEENLLRFGQSVSWIGSETGLIWVTSGGAPVCLAQGYESHLIPKRVFRKGESYDVDNC